MLGLLVKQQLAMVKYTLTMVRVSLRKIALVLGKLRHQMLLGSGLKRHVLM
jgi:hypothetical protein